MAYLVFWPTCKNQHSQKSTLTMALISLCKRVSSSRCQAKHLGANPNLHLHSKHCTAYHSNPPIAAQFYQSLPAWCIERCFIWGSHYLLDHSITLWCLNLICHAGERNSHGLHLFHNRLSWLYVWHKKSYFVKMLAIGPGYNSSNCLVLRGPGSPTHLLQKQMSRRTWLGIAWSWLTKFTLCHKYFRLLRVQVDEDFLSLLIDGLLAASFKLSELSDRKSYKCNPFVINDQSMCVATFSVLQRGACFKDVWRCVCLWKLVERVWFEQGNERWLVTGKFLLKYWILECWWLLSLIAL